MEGVGDGCVGPLKASMPGFTAELVGFLSGALGRHAN
jgi:hypothetical protein